MKSTGNRVPRTIACAALPLLVLLSCNGNQVALDSKGIQSGHIERLFWYFLAVTAVMSGVVLIGLIIGIFRPRRKPQGPPEVQPMPESYGPSEHPVEPLDNKTDLKAVRAVTAAGIVSLVGLLSLLISSVSTGHELAKLPEDGALEVDIIGHQWWWEIHYPDANDPSQSVVTANELHLPSDRTIKIVLQSTDVIHSFWVPNLHGKRDLIPGYTNVYTLKATTPGHFRGQCAEFCGYQHAQMGLEVFVESPEQFGQWLTAQRQPAPPPTNADQMRGKDVFEHGPCAMCHTVAGTDARATIGPNLTHLMSRQTLAAGTLPNTRGSLAGWVLNAQGIKPGAQMPSLSLPANDFQALLSYLETLK